MNGTNGSAASPAADATDATDAREQAAPRSSESEGEAAADADDLADRKRLTHRLLTVEERVLYYLKYTCTTNGL